MNQRCVTKIQNVKDTMAEIVDGLDQLIAAIEEDDEEKVDQVLDGMPTARAMAKSYEDLGLLIKTCPWEGGKKGKKNG
jgi:hypothetical protein